MSNFTGEKLNHRLFSNSRNHGNEILSISATIYNTMETEMKQMPRGDVLVVESADKDAKWSYKDPFKKLLPSGWLYRWSFLSKRGRRFCLKLLGNGASLQEILDAVADTTGDVHEPKVDVEQKIRRLCANVYRRCLERVKMPGGQISGKDINPSKSDWEEALQEMFIKKRWNVS